MTGWLQLRALKGRHHPAGAALTARGQPWALQFGSRNKERNAAVPAAAGWKPALLSGGAFVPWEGSSANETRIQGLTPLAMSCLPLGARRVDIAQSVPWEG